MGHDCCNLSCVLPNHQFYLYILAASTALLCAYILCNMYNFVWIICPQLGTMYRVIKSYQDCLGGDGTAQTRMSMSSKKTGQRHHLSNNYRKVSNITTDNFLNVYFDRRHKDLKLLLNLLAETSGLPESFRILTLFDKKFQSLWKPQNLRIEDYETILSTGEKAFNITVKWNDAPIGHFLSDYDSSLNFEYTLDITPSPLNELGLKSVLYKRDENVLLACTHSNQSISLLEYGKDSNNVNKYRYEVIFENIVKEGEDATQLEAEQCSDKVTPVTLTISTELNGRTVTQMVEKFGLGGKNNNSGENLRKKQRASFCSIHSSSKKVNSFNVSSESQI